MYWKNTRMPATFNAKMILILGTSHKIGHFICPPCMEHYPLHPRSAKNTSSLFLKNDLIT